MLPKPLTDAEIETAIGSGGLAMPHHRRIARMAAEDACDKLIADVQRELDLSFNYLSLHEHVVVDSFVSKLLKEWNKPWTEPKPAPQEKGDNNAT